MHAAESLRPLHARFRPGLAAVHFTATLATFWLCYKVRSER